MKITKQQLKQIIKEEIGKVLNEREVVTYNGNAVEFIKQVEDYAKKMKLGWEFIEDDYVDPRDEMIDWDKAMKAATEFLEDHGVEIEYN